MASYCLTVEELPAHTHTVYKDDNYCPVNTGNINNDWKQALIGIGRNTVTQTTRYRYGIGYEGGSKSHANVQPSIAVYGWKRTA